METTYFDEREVAAATRRERLLASGVVVLTVAALLYVRFFNPSAPGSLYPSCPFNSLTGLYCPGCGMTRGLHQLTHGHFLEALHYNALMLMLLPFAAYAFVSYALVAARGRGLPMPFTRPAYVKALFWVVMVFWVVRNIPVYPLTLLAP